MSTSDPVKKSDTNASLFLRFFWISVPLAVLAIYLLITYGEKLSPKYSSYQQGEYNSRAVEAIAATNNVLKSCIKENQTKTPKNCEHFIEILEVSKGALDLAAQESMANSTFRMSQINYWQYLATGLTAIFLMMTVGATYVFLYEAGVTSNAARKAADAAVESSRAHVYASFQALRLTGGEVNNFAIMCEIKNYGASPARSIKYDLVIRSLTRTMSVVHASGPPHNAGEIDVLGPTDSRDVGVNRPNRTMMIFDIASLLGAERDRMFLSYSISYETIFNEPKAASGEYEVLAISQGQFQLNRQFAEARSSDDSELMDRLRSIDIPVGSVTELRVQSTSSS